MMKVSFIPVLPHRVAVFTPGLVVFETSLVKADSKASAKALAILMARGSATGGRVRSILKESGNIPQ